MLVLPQAVPAGRGVPRGLPRALLLPQQVRPAADARVRAQPGSAEPGRGQQEALQAAASRPPLRLSKVTMEISQPAHY